jgi:amidase
VSADLERATTHLAGRQGIDLRLASVDALQQAMQRDALSAVELTETCLERIAQLDPALGAVIAVSPRAAEEAARSDARRAAGAPPRPLEGIPVLVKDNIAAAGLPTTAGSLALGRSIPPEAPCVSRLRRAGAVILGKVNLSEWANFRSERSLSGWSSIRGQARNPHVLDRSPSRFAPLSAAVPRG